MKERPETHKGSQCASKVEQPFPPGWPTDVPLPTLEEAELAVRKIEELIVQFKKEDKKELQDQDDEEDDDIRKVIITI